MATLHFRENRHGRSASLAIISDANSIALPLSNNGHSRFDGPRSPPNTAHVPCKFFRQGACQAGNACPFSHEIGSAADAICKYFAKGNCKFGPKCANIHILPNGKRINYHKSGISLGDSPLTHPRRPMPIPPSFGQSPTSTSALTNGIYAADAAISKPTRISNLGTFMHPYVLAMDDRQPHFVNRPPSTETGLLDSSFQLPDTTYTSPHDEAAVTRFGLALSPIKPKSFSVLDAPLPASFDSNGISNAARFPAAPWPSSMPSKYGLDSLSHSLNPLNDPGPSEALKLLHSSAFGSNDYLTHAPIAPSSSPPFQVDDHTSKRVLRSSHLYKNRIPSSSVPKTVDRDWDPEFPFLEEDCVPHNLRELLTPIEKARRGSVRAVDAEAPSDGLKYGSPAAVSSMWGPFYQRPKEEELEPSRWSKYPMFGHVGSPLRNSSLAHEPANDGHFNTATARPSTAPRVQSDSVSVLTQQLQKSRIVDRNPSPGSPHLHPAAASCRAHTVISAGRTREFGVERHLSNSSICSSAASRLTRPIDEETAVFSMEEDELQQHQAPRQQPNGESGRISSGIWSYAAGIAAGKENGSGARS